MKNRTLKNLELLWIQLDDACSYLDNAQTNIATMKNLPEEIKELNDRIDLQKIVSLNNRVRELIELKKGELV
jgi:hypothetical protein